jgi:hypothetical protein
MRNRGVEVSLMPLHAQSRDVLGLLCAIEADAPPEVASLEQGSSMDQGSSMEQGSSLEAAAAQVASPTSHASRPCRPLAATPLAMMAAHARAQVAALGGALSPSTAQHSAIAQHGAIALVQWGELALRRRQRGSAASPRPSWTRGGSWRLPVPGG